LTKSVKNAKSMADCKTDTYLWYETWDEKVRHHLVWQLGKSKFLMCDTTRILLIRFYHKLVGLDWQLEKAYNKVNYLNVRIVT
jgi:hypothetical protein